MADQEGKPRSVAIREYKKRVDFHRSIHRDLDDGALIAICENYREESPKKGK